MPRDAGRESRERVGNLLNNIIIAADNGARSPDFPFDVRPARAHVINKLVKRGPRQTYWSVKGTTLRRLQPLRTYCST